MYKHCQNLLGDVFEFEPNIWKYRHFLNGPFSSFDGGKSLYTRCGSGLRKQQFH